MGNPLMVEPESRYVSAYQMVTDFRQEKLFSDEKMPTTPAVQLREALRQPRFNGVIKFKIRTLIWSIPTPWNLLRRLARLALPERFGKSITTFAARGEWWRKLFNPRMGYAHCAIAKVNLPNRLTRHPAERGYGGNSWSQLLCSSITRIAMLLTENFIDA